jgi:hypothetical protein
MKRCLTYRLALLACASLIASCGGASAPNSQPVAVVLPPPPPAPDPAPAAEPEPTRASPPKSAAPARTARPSAPPPPPFNAPPPSPHATAAETLFIEARQLFAQGDFAKACPKFEESNRLDPAIGTLLNLAACEEKAGQRPQACAHYAEVARLTQQSGQQERARFAQKKVQNLGCPP